MMETVRDPRLPVSNLGQVTDYTYCHFLCIFPQPVQENGWINPLTKSTVVFPESLSSFCPIRSCMNSVVETVLLNDLKLGTFCARCLSVVLNHLSLSSLET